MEGALLTLTLLCGLATWRLSSLLHTEDLFEWLRKWIGIENDDNGLPVLYPDTLWGKIFDCFWCLSLVAAIPIVTLATAWAGLDFIWGLLIWPASSTVSIYIEKQIMRTQSR